MAEMILNPDRDGLNWIVEETCDDATIALNEPKLGVCIRNYLIDDPARDSYDRLGVYIDTNLDAACLDCVEISITDRNGDFQSAFIPAGVIMRIAQSIKLQQRSRDEDEYDKDLQRTLDRNADVDEWLSKQKP